MDRRVITLFGPPGTGKTHAGLTIADQYFKSGGSPERIAYVSFTRKAAHEAASRAAQRFGFSTDDLPYFRTLHSIAFRELGLSRSDVMARTHWKEIGDGLGLDFGDAFHFDQERLDRLGHSVGAQLLQTHALARARLLPIADQWRTGATSQLPLWSHENFDRELSRYKREKGVLDFTDFLDECQVTLDLDMFILDEAQDLTPQQWRFARRLAAKAKTIVVAGDDDQAIFDWAGADSSQMARFFGTRVTLPLSHRLPRSVFDLSSTVLRRIAHRVDKTWSPRDDEGVVDHLLDWRLVDVSEGEWLILTRHRRQLDEVEAWVRSQGYVYRREGEWSNHDEVVRAVVCYERLRRGDTVSLPEARIVCSWIVDAVRPIRGQDLSWADLGLGSKDRPWYDALTRLSPRDVEYVRALLRRGESPTKPGRITLSTIHGAKGGEADNVLLWPTPNGRVRKSMMLDSDPEHRVLYVGMTRARRRLIICDER